MKKIFSTIGKVAFVLFLILPILLLAYVLSVRAGGGIPSVFGYNVSLVITPSMEDVLPVGSLIISRDYDGGELKEGDIITYQGEVGSYADKLVTHEVIGFDTDEDGNEVIITKGTQNQVEDPPVRKDMVRSVFVRKILNLGWLYRFVSEPFGFLLLCVLPIVGFIVFEIVECRNAFRKEDNQDEIPEKENDSPAE